MHQGQHKCYTTLLWQSWRKQILFNLYIWFPESTDSATYIGLKRNTDATHQIPTVNQPAEANAEHKSTSASPTVAFLQYFITISKRGNDSQVFWRFICQSISCYMLENVFGAIEPLNMIEICSFLRLTIFLLVLIKPSSFSFTVKMREGRNVEQPDWFLVYWPLTTDKMTTGSLKATLCGSWLSSLDCGISLRIFIEENGRMLRGGYQECKSVHIRNR